MTTDNSMQNKEPQTTIDGNVTDSAEQVQPDQVKEETADDLGLPPTKDDLLTKLTRCGFILLSLTFICSCFCGRFNIYNEYHLFHTIACSAIVLMLCLRAIERFYLCLGRRLWLADVELSLLSLAVTQWVAVLLSDHLGSIPQFLVLLLFVGLGATLDKAPIIVTIFLYSLADIIGMIYNSSEINLWPDIFILIMIWLAAFIGNILFSTTASLQKIAFARSKSDYENALRTRAKLYRLLPQDQDKYSQSAKLDDNEKQLALLTASLDAVRNGFYNLINVFWASIEHEASSLVFFELNENTLYLREHRGLGNSQVSGKQFDKNQGIFAMILRKREATKLEPASGRLPQLQYLNENGLNHSLLALPLMIHKETRGLLIIHSATNKIAPLIEENGRCLVDELSRLVSFEELFNDMYDERVRYNTLSEAASGFNRVMGLDNVAKVAMSAARKLSQAQFAAITLRQKGDNDTYVDTIIACDSDYDQHQLLIGKKIAPGTGLVASVMKIKQALPENTKLGERQVIFDNNNPVKELKGARIYPLSRAVENGTEIIGTLIVGSANPNFLPFKARKLLGVIAEQTATSINNAQLYDKTKEQARNDGLTGLLNHRTFQEQFTEIYNLAKRTQRGFCFMIADIDHFKQVNDTYGHPMGDKVLKNVAKCIKETARNTDIVARYGGEEFAIIMPDTDCTGAKRTAERIRENVSKISFQSSNGPFHCHLSMGISCYPLHKKERQEVINAADEALYCAKEGGRNQSVIYGQKGQGSEAQ